ncbi:MAG TPA: restriction endonuclease [Blastocatellia bacterium]|nr:restriction endonuclease [Blastocatellia bacterium]
MKAPHRAIAGFGYFATWSTLPDWLAWECFGDGNGCATLDDLQHRIAGIRQRIGYVPQGQVANIGCTILVQPTFFAKDSWIPQPFDWSDRIVTTRSYDLTEGEGLRIWEACLERIADVAAHDNKFLHVAGPVGPRYGSPRPVSQRLGQGTFRVGVTDAYSRACAVTGEHSLPALEAAHIRSYAKEGPHEIQNGILLRADLHRLFDKGYLTVTSDHHLEVSSRLRAEFSNGRSYYPLHGASLSLPSVTRDRPAAEYLAWHNDHVYLR